MGETITDKSQQVAVLENSLDVLKTGPKILIANQERKDKVLKVGQTILAIIESKGIDAEVDERAMKFLANVKAANKEMKESRAGVTQIMDELKKMYTTVENELDVDKPNTIPARIQGHRDRYAKEQSALAEKKRREAEVAAAKEKEAIDIKFRIEGALNNYFGSHLLEKKTKLQDAFNEATLETISDVETKMKGFTPKYSKQHFDTFSSGHAGASILEPHEVKAICDQVMMDKYNGFADLYVKELSTLRDDILTKFPSKLSELNEQKRLADEAEANAAAAKKAEQERQAAIASANAKEKKRLEAEAAKAREEEKIKQEELKKQQEAAAEEQRRREEEDRQRMAKEAEDARLKAEQEALIKKQGEETMVLFNKEAEIADTTAPPEARQGYEIEILHPVGYTQIFAFWFENEGKNLPVDKIGNTKLDQMKGWAEKKAYKDGTKIESKFLKYNDTFKAVNRKVK